MCGIAAIVGNWTAERLAASVRRLNDLQAHRGPDGAGEILRSGAALGHRRLSIIDIDGGAQPIANEDGDVWVTFNGEIYNFISLRAELEANGHVFRSKSDSEVIVHAWEEWGEACVSRFRGMFAFVIADYRTARVFAARDVFGIKPLIYRVEDGATIFGSELAAVAQVPVPCLAGRLSSVDLFLRGQYIPDPFTIYSNIWKLPPGHCLAMSMQGEQPKVWRYHDSLFSQPRIRDCQAVDQFANALDESVAAHLVADVPFGMLLSGGLDSTCVADSLARQGHAGLKAFHIGFGPGALSETGYAQTASAQTGLSLVTEDVLSIPSELHRTVLRAYGEPFGDSSAIPTWLVSRLARAHVPMVLSGDGGDEFFGGYHTYEQWLSRRDARPSLRMIFGNLRRFRWFRAKAQISALRSERSLSLERRILDWLEFNSTFTIADRLNLWKQPHQRVAHCPSPTLGRASKQWAGQGELDLAQRLDIDSYLSGSVLTKVDVASMAHGLEVRTPLIDRELSRFAFSLPERWRVRRAPDQRWHGKEIVKQHLERRYSSSFTRRAKYGFGLPRTAAFMPSLSVVASLVQAQLSDWFEPDAITAIAARAPSDDASYRKLWLLYCLACWREEHPAVIFDGSS